MYGDINLTNIPEGLKEQQIAALRQQYGWNIFRAGPSRHLTKVLKGVVWEPMFLLLVSACTLYFVLNRPEEGIMMLVAITIVVTISIYQEWKSSKALRALKEFTMPLVSVIRGGIEKRIRTTELVPGDVMIVEEGNKVPADGKVINANDFSVNEAIITGESLPVYKNYKQGNNLIYQGTSVNSGKCYAEVTATGNATVLGKLGKTVAEIEAPKTPLQQDVSRFVRRLAGFGLGAFVVIWIINYSKSGDALGSLLFGLTLAMAAIPEEIPVAFSSFMALGAYNLSRLGIISRHPKVIENLGAVSVICLDKTGTITENKMDVRSIYDFESDRLTGLQAGAMTGECRLLRFAALASEAEPFDEMEKGILRAYQLCNKEKLMGNLRMVYEYPLSGSPPMMTHVYQFENLKIIAAKGAAERVFEVCSLNTETKNKLNRILKQMAGGGHRVLGVASAIHADGQLPAEQEGFNWKFEGLISLFDPPKKNMQQVLTQFYDAGISIKMVTGDYPETAIHIAEQVGLFAPVKYLDGETVLQMPPGELRDTAKEIQIFARMFPEAKQKLVEALKSGGEIVAMTGDGVNDAPALASADIGIAMGKKGTELAKQSADLVLTDDDLEKLVIAIHEGRRIFGNLKKAVRYIISIHIPIILTAVIPVLFGWLYPNIFTPVHVIFLELIMGPTCSIFYEKEPVEKDIMRMPPRKKNISMFGEGELLISIFQGLIITSGVLLLYHISMRNGNSIEHTRAMVFTTLIISNIFLTFVNRSFTETISKTIRYPNILAPVVFLASIIFLLLIHLVPGIRELFGMSAISINQFLICTVTAFVSVMWFEVYKMDLKMIFKQSFR